MSWVVDPDVGGRTPARACGHLVQLPDELSPRCVDGCGDCLGQGTGWAELCECVTCGYVGCCGGSPMRHAGTHHRATGHPLVRSLQPGQTVAWCYPDRVRLRAITPHGKPS